MAKSPINIIGGFYKDPNLHWSRQDTLNWIPVGAEQPGTLTQWQLRDAPGVKPYVRITRTVPTEEGNVVIDVGPIRGMRNVEGKFFVVAAQTVYQISNTGVAIPVGSIPGVGRVSMAHNQYGLSNQLIIVNGSAGYIVDTNLLTVTKITDEGYPGAFVADYIDQYLAQVEPQGRFWFHSDLAQGLHYNTLDRYEAEADPDRIVSLIVSHREVLIFGRDTIEPFVNTGGQTGTFERASNTVIEVGCAAKFTPRKLDNSVFWLDDKRLVRRLDGYTPIRISTDAIDAAFSECSEQEISQAYAFTWETRGHKVYYITVPGRFTFGFDVLTRQWHRRATWSLPHWDAVDAVFWNGRWYVGSGQNGRIYELDQDYKLDRCDPLVRKRITGKLWDAENELTLNNVELKFNTGGVESVCIPFPVQPIGPTITGNAPDGSLALPYPDYTYTVTPGDAPIARTVILSSSAPIASFGFEWDQFTATLSGEPTRNGSLTLTLRTYDTNGLFDDHTDTIVIAVPIMVYGATSAVSRSLLISPSGLDYSGSLFNTSSQGNILGITGGRFLSWDTGNVDYSDNFGASWTTSASSLGGSGGGRQGAYSGQNVWIAGGISGVYKSTDRGVTFTQKGNPPDSNYLAFSNEADRLGMIYGAASPDANYSDDLGETFSAGVDSAITVSGGGVVRESGGWFVVCGRNSGTNKPRIAFTQDFTSYTRYDLPSVSGTLCRAAWVEVIEGDTTWVFADDAGEIFYTTNRGGSIQTATDSLGAPARDIIYNGVNWIIGGGGSGNGVIKTSTNLSTWTAQTQPFGYEVIAFARYEP